MGTRAQNRPALQAKDIPQFLKPMDNKHNSLNLAAKITWIFVLGHYLFLEAHSFPRASLSENCSLRGTDNRELN